MLELRKAQDRGVAEFGWLHSRHTFSFGHYVDPMQHGFSELLVINDDRVEPGKGFGTHPHNSMEIFSYVLEGELAHQDSMGNGSVIRPGDVQLMSAGTGVRHSEFNHSENALVHFLQIWIVPRLRASKPGYQQTHFSAADKRGRLRLILSPDGADGSLTLLQDARIYAGLFDGAESATLDLAQGRYAYVHLARGALTLNGVALGEGDGVKVRDETLLTLGQGQDAEVLVFDLPAREMPSR